MDALAADYADVSDLDGEPICVWERVSTDMTRQEVAAQTRDLKGHLSGGCYRVVKVFRFEASAYHGHHSGQQAELLDDVAAGQYKVVVSAMTSRYERRGWQAAMLLGLQLHQMGARVVAIDDPNYGDFSNITGGIVTMVKADSDHNYSDSISKNVKRTFRMTDEQNVFRGAIPGGYSSVGGKREKQLVPHPYAAEIVVQAFLDCAGKSSTPKLARTFKAANERYNADLPEGARKLRLPETADGVQKMLRSEVYSTGRHSVNRQDGSTYVYQGPALVSPAQQQKAIASLESRRTGDNVTSRAIAKEDFSGAMWCAEHGDGTTGRGYRYFGGGRPRKDGSPGARMRRYRFECCGKSVRSDDADEGIDTVLGADVTPWWVPFSVDPNAERDRALNIIERRLVELPSLALDEDDEDARRTELRAERKRLQAIPDEPAFTYARQKTDDEGHALTEGDRWRMMSPAEKRDHLTSGNFLVLVSAVGDRSGRVVVKIEEPGDE